MATDQNPSDDGSDLGTIRQIDGKVVLIDGSGSVHEISHQEIPSLLDLGFRWANDTEDRAARSAALDKLSPSQSLDQDYGDSGKTRQDMDEVVDHRGDTALKTMPVEKISRKPVSVSLEVIQPELQPGKQKVGAKGFQPEPGSKLDDPAPNGMELDYGDSGATRRSMDEVYNPRRKIPDAGVPDSRAEFGSLKSLVKGRAKR